MSFMKADFQQLPLRVVGQIGSNISDRRTMRFDQIYEGAIASEYECLAGQSA
jgi:hypothetical protein